MTPQHIVALGIRLFAVWLWLSSIRYLSSVPLYIASTGDIAEKVYQAYLVAGAYLLAGLLLWFFPLATAHKLIPSARMDDKFKLDATSISKVGCALMGLWLLTKSIPGIVGTFITLSLNNVSIRGLDAVSQAEFGIYLCNLVLALLFIFKSETFAAIVLHGTNKGNE